MNQNVILTKVEFKILSENQKILNEAQIVAQSANEKLNNVLSLVQERCKIENFDNIEFDIDNQQLIFIYNEKAIEELPVKPNDGDVKYKSFLPKRKIKSWFRR
jgi:hypothetical protein